MRGPARMTAEWHRPGSGLRARECSGPRPPLPWLVVLAAVMALSAVMAPTSARAGSVCGVSADGSAPLTGQGATAAGAVAFACGPGAQADGFIGENTAVGRDANARGDQAGNTALGSDAFAQGNQANNTAIGTDSRAGGDAGHNTAVGFGANAAGIASNNTAIGEFANAGGSQANNVAIGGAATASGANRSSTAVGFDARATGVDTAAFGATSRATGVNASAFGRGAQATADNAVAAGSGATASGTGSASYGNASVASGLTASAFGAGAQATADNASAIGSGAVAAHSNASAIGRGATTTRANQVMVGSASNTYTLAGIGSAASRAAQTGPTQFVTSDASGNLALSPISPASLSALDGRIGALESAVAGLQGDIRRSYEGTAIALAMAGANLPDSKRFAVSANWGTFRGEHGLAATAAVRLTDNAFVHGGIGIGTSRGGIGGRAGITFAW
ncbi:hypothetical protein E8M01_27375 [Phreatobacter stygius]|uniref:Trimeric autotransporter adhesin YadA-like C-terminal membrane anchor domain-containing protein n=1 Tax=Phreatobacter stygius TaxID=1940610 RepID=A0A4D7BAF9_9HYPH|nr:hypothetical protein E8M01_27375 [Phreatobacter stygius]